MPENKIVKQEFYKIPVSEKDHRFLMRLNDKTKKQLSYAIRVNFLEVLYRVKEGKSI